MTRHLEVPRERSTQYQRHSAVEAIDLLQRVTADAVGGLADTELGKPQSAATSLALKRFSRFIIPQKPK